ncbi:MAG: hypothetical protein AAGI23_08430 [Bacteroidota bacterium]
MTKTKARLLLLSAVIASILLGNHIFYNTNNKFDSYFDDLKTTNLIDHRFNSFIKYQFEKSLQHLELDVDFTINSDYSESGINIYVFNSRYIDSNEYTTIGNMDWKRFNSLCVDNFVAIRPNIIMIDAYYLSYLALECYNEFLVWTQVHDKDSESYDINDFYMSSFNLSTYNRLNTYKNLYKTKTKTFDLIIPTKSEWSADSEQTIDDNFACQLSALEGIDNLETLEPENFNCSGGIIRLFHGTGLVYNDRFQKDGDPFEIESFARGVWALRNRLTESEYHSLVEEVGFNSDGITQKYSDAFYDIFVPFYLFIISHEIAHIQQFNSMEMEDDYYSWIDLDSKLNKLASKKTYYLEEQADLIAYDALQSYVEKSSYNNDYMYIPQIIGLNRVFRDIVIGKAFSEFRGIDGEDVVVSILQKIDQDSATFSDNQFHNFERIRNVVQNELPIVTSKEFSDIQHSFEASGSSSTHRHIYLRTLDIINVLDKKYDDTKIDNLVNSFNDPFEEFFYSSLSDSENISDYQLDLHKPFIEYSKLKPVLEEKFSHFSSAKNSKDIIIAESIDGIGYARINKDDYNRITNLFIILPLFINNVSNENVEWIARLLPLLDVSGKLSFEDVNQNLGNAFARIIIKEESAVQILISGKKLVLENRNNKYIVLKTTNEFNAEIPTYEAKLR